MTTKREGDALTEQGPEIEVSDEPDEIRAQIEETRAELGDTVEALAAKADVKAQVKNKLAVGKEQIKEKREEVTAKLPGVRNRGGAPTTGQGGSAIGSLPERIKGRPIPAVFIAGLVLGWLVGRRG
jgi:hypothetical protein